MQLVLKKRTFIQRETRIFQSGIQSVVRMRLLRLNAEGETTPCSFLSCPVSSFIYSLPLIYLLKSPASLINSFLWVTLLSVYSAPHCCVQPWWEFHICCGVIKLHTPPAGKLPPLLLSPLTSVVGLLCCWAFVCLPLGWCADLSTLK